MRILLDMDGIVVDMLGVWLDRFNNDHGTDLTKEGCIDWNFNYLPKNQVDKMFSYINEPGFFRNLPPMLNAINSIYKLHSAGHEILFVTTPPEDSPTASYDKLEWLKENLPFLDNHKKRFICTASKFLVRGDILFDDSANNITDFKNKGSGLTCIMTYPHNIGCQADYRVFDWNGFGEVIARVNTYQSFL